MNDRQKRQAAVNKLMRKRGLSRSAAEAEVSTTGLDAVVIALGGVSSSDCGSSSGGGYSGSDGGGSSYGSSDGGGSYSSGE